MGALINFSFKNPDGSYENYTMSVNDETNQYGQNVSVFKRQTKEQRDAKEKRDYVGNGTVAWTDGKVVVAERKEATENPVAELDF